MKLDGQWKCICTKWNDSALPNCRYCGSPKGQARMRRGVIPAEPEKPLAFTNEKFAQHCTRMAAKCAGWSGDILDSPGEPARRDAVRRFLAEMRERLNFMEEELNG